MSDVGSILEGWREAGHLREMKRLHGAFIGALAAYAGFDLGGGG